MLPQNAVRRIALRGAVAASTTAVASGAGSVAAAAYMARKVLTPDHRRADDTQVLEVGDDTVVLDLTPETVVPGRYGLWLKAGAGHARVGEVLDVDVPGRRVERELLGVDKGVLIPGGARWNGYYFGMPPDRSIGAPTERVQYAGELGPMPAWVVPPADGRAGERWAILVHGRGARREETIRALPTLRAAGWTSLVPAYRNDEGVPAGPDGRYNLGLSEWRDIEAAALYAAGRGARRLLVFGWSMGGAITLQYLSQSWTSSMVERVVLDGPVIDWSDVLEFHAREHRVPKRVGSLSRTMMGRRWGRRLVGVHEAVDVARTNWVARSAELSHPMLLIHSADDEFVPVGPSRALAAARPDLVRFEEWQVARHCKEWNTDTERWERAVHEFATG